MKTTLDWYEVVINDYKLLSGCSVISLIEFINLTEKCHYAYCDALDGGYIHWFLENQRTILDYANIVTNFNNNIIFEWGDFFFFNDKPIKFNCKKTLKYSEIVSQTDFTLRLVDGNYVYVYTKKIETVESLEKKYKTESITFGNIYDFTYPE